MTEARIKFFGNPWPAGHAVTEAVWSAELRPDGLRFHLHVVSADYDAEDDRDDPEGDRGAWRSRIVWTNYHACSLSSTKWGDDGFLVATPGKPIDLERLASKTFRVDPMAGDAIPEDVELDDLAFGIYLLGHDSVCDHRIRFVKRRGPRCYDIRWRARIALTYAGDTELSHRLEATLPRLRLDTIELEDLDATTARALLPEVLVGAERFTLRRGRFVSRPSR